MKNHEVHKRGKTVLNSCADKKKWCCGQGKHEQQNSQYLKKKINKNLNRYSRNNIGHTNHYVKYYVKCTCE